MPELPEVETVKSSLEPHLIGKTIKEVKVLYRNLIDTDDFEKKLVSQKIIKLNRVPKPATELTRASIKLKTTKTQIA